MAHAGCEIAAIAMKLPEPEFLFANSKFYEMHGCTRSDYHKKTDINYSIIVSEDREKSKSIYYGYES